VWATVPFDLDDPLYVVEIGGHHLIVEMGAAKGKSIGWIDDLAGMAFPPGQGISLPPAPAYVARAR